MRCIVLAILLVLSVAGLAQAGTITDRQPSGDTGVRKRSAYANTNYGSSGSFAFSDWDGYISWGDDMTQHVMLKFDISDVEATVSSATLQIYGTSTGAGNAALIYLGTSDNLAEDWDESTVTWNTCSGGSINSGVSAGFTTVSGYQSIDVTALIQAAVTAGQSKVTLYPSMNVDAVSCTIYMKETSARTPLLSIESIPEPVTLSLLAIGGIAALTRRYR